MSSKRNFLFIDNETLAINDHGVILSVGALFVSEDDMKKPASELLENNTKTWKLDSVEQISSFGRLVSKDVLQWWTEQGEEAQKVLNPSNEDISAEEFLDDLRDWLADVGYNRGDNWLSGTILQRGTIDFPMIANLARDVHGTEEWLYEYISWRKVRDIRSIIDTLNLGVYDAMNIYSVPCEEAVKEYTDGKFSKWWDYLDHFKKENNLVTHDAASDCLIQFESMRVIGFA